MNRKKRPTLKDPNLDLTGKSHVASGFTVDENLSYAEQIENYQKVTTKRFSKQNNVQYCQIFNLAIFVHGCLVILDQIVYQGNFKSPLPYIMLACFGLIFKILHQPNII